MPREPSLRQRLGDLRAYLAAGLQPEDFMGDLYRFLKARKHGLASLAEDDYELALDRLDQRTRDAFVAWLRDVVVPKVFSYRPEDLPAPLLLERPRVLPASTWLVHLTDAPEEIARGGFTRGEQNMQRLGGTTDRFGDCLYGCGEVGPGWNFAYLAEDVRLRNYDSSWGDNAVVFQAPCVLAHHFTGEAWYAIFWGPAVRRMVPVVCTDEHQDCEVTSGRGAQRLCSDMTLPDAVACIQEAAAESRRGLWREVRARTRHPAR
jgi:hypothetical protein